VASIALALQWASLRMLLKAKPAHVLLELAVDETEHNIQVGNVRGTQHIMMCHGRLRARADNEAGELWAVQDVIMAPAVLRNTTAESMPRLNPQQNTVVQPLFPWQGCLLCCCTRVL